jgi:L-tartrate/succinate antiporter
VGLLAVAALVGWIGGSRWMSPVVVALAIISMMLLAKVVTWNDILANKQAWSARL